jgi:hypothetical protein
MKMGQTIIIEVALDILKHVIYFFLEMTHPDSDEVSGRLCLYMAANSHLLNDALHIYSISKYCVSGSISVNQLLPRHIFTLFYIILRLL